MNKIKIILLSIVSVVLIALSTTVAIQNNKISSLNNALSSSHSNEKALLLKSDEDKNEIRSLQFTVEQLNYFNDSVILELNKVRQELNIKDKDLKQLQYLKTLAKKTDTIIVKDTIFVEDLTLDTTIQDTWHKTNIQLLYPSTIIINPEFISDKKIVTYLKKETIKPPKKCKFARAFQKKHKVIVVNIQENNPYITTKEHQHIEIIK